MRTFPKISPQNASFRIILRIPFVPIAFLFLEILLTVQGVNARSGWKDIIPLITTREEVERKLGKPQKYGFYELNEGRVSIGYVSSKCEKIIRCDCLAPIGTVLYIRIQLYHDLFIKDLNLNPKVYKKKQVTNQIITYANFNKGIVYEVVDGKVVVINYYESENTCNQILKKH